MADIIHLHRSPHDETQMLLPWWVNGTLSADEAAIVQSHIGECAECRRDAAAERELFRQVAEMPRIASGRREAAPKPPAAIFFLRRRVPVAWLLAGQLATAAAIALAIYAPAFQEAPAPTYQTLGSPGHESAGNVVVVFHPQNSELDMRNALANAGARIVDGPNASGAYVLNVPPASRREAVDRLRAMPQVMLAEPIDPAAGP